LLGLAAFNLLVVRPHFLNFVWTGIRSASRVLLWERRFRWVVAAEVSFAAAILIIAALLTETSTPTRGSAAGDNGVVSRTPSTSPTPSSLAQTQEADDLTISLDVFPGKAGQNDIGVFLNDNDGNEAPVQSVIIRYKYLDKNLGENEDFAEPFHPPTHYTLQTSQLSLAGEWEIETIIRREGLLDARATFTVSITS
jgi:hypothetical protein